MLRSPLHSLPISLLLSRSLLCRLPGEADLRFFNFCRLIFQNVLVVSYPFSFSISIFCFSDFRTKFRQILAEAKSSDIMTNLAPTKFGKITQLQKKGIFADKVEAAELCIGDGAAPS